MGAAHLLSEMMVVLFDGAANQIIKGNHDVSYYRLDHQTQNRGAEPGRKIGQRIEGLASHGHVTRYILPLQIGGRGWRCPWQACFAIIRAIGSDTI